MAIEEYPYDPNEGHELHSIRAPGYRRQLGPLVPQPLKVAFYNLEFIGVIPRSNKTRHDVFSTPLQRVESKGAKRSTLIQTGYRQLNEPRSLTTAVWLSTRLEFREGLAKLLDQVDIRGAGGPQHQIPFEGTTFLERILKPWHTVDPLSVFAPRTAKMISNVFSLSKIVWALRGGSSLDGLIIPRNVQEYAAMITDAQQMVNPMWEAGDIQQFDGGIMQNPINLKIPGERQDLVIDRYIPPFAYVALIKNNLYTKFHALRWYMPMLIEPFQKFNKDYHGVADDTVVPHHITRTPYMIPNDTTSDALKVDNHPRAIYGSTTNYYTSRPVFHRLVVNFKMRRMRDHYAAWFDAPLYIFGRVWGGVETVYAPRFTGRVNGDWNK